MACGWAGVARLRPAAHDRLDADPSALVAADVADVSTVILVEAFVRHFLDRLKNGWVEGLQAAAAAFQRRLVEAASDAVWINPQTLDPVVVGPPG